jgi:hypothetical protein
MPPPIYFQDCQALASYVQSPRDLPPQTMSYTTNYLQSESVAAQGAEVIVVVNCMI